VSDRRTRNNINRNNQIAADVPTKEVSAEEFHYEELNPDQVAALYQERWTQHLDGGLNRGGGVNDKQQFKITEQRVQDRHTTFGMCYRREYVA
jgi:hypothetical protein